MRAKPQVQLHPPCTVKNTCPDTRAKGVIMSQDVFDCFFVSLCSFGFFGAFEVMTCVTV